MGIFGSENVTCRLNGWYMNNIGSAEGVDLYGWSIVNNTWTVRRCDGRMGFWRKLSICRVYRPPNHVSAILEKLMLHISLTFSKSLYHVQHTIDISIENSFQLLMHISIRIQILFTLYLSYPSSTTLVSGKSRNFTL